MTSPLLWLLTVAACVAYASALPIDVRSPDQDTPQETPVQAFARSDLNKDASLTFDEFLHTDLLYEQLKREEFDALDANHDGILTKAEYDAHFQKEKESSDDLRAEYFGKIFEDFDENFDLKLSPEEVKKVLEKRFLLKTRENFPEIFRAFDKNANGGLELEEYVKFDSEMPFQELDPLPAAEVETTTTDAPTPILAFKTEKLPLMKRKYFEKY
ncbi:Protein F23F1.2 [Aphelenchoides avenae]|nr:Protein F23F1.2 [Aphelenchus avenae]